MKFKAWGGNVLKEYVVYFDRTCGAPQRRSSPFAEVPQEEAGQDLSFIKDIAFVDPDPFVMYDAPTTRKGSRTRFGPARRASDGGMETMLSTRNALSEFGALLRGIL